MSELSKKITVNLIKLSLVILFFSLFIDCSVQTGLYIQNTTNKSQILRIKYKTQINNWSEHRNFKYTEGIKSPKEFRESTNVHKLEFKKLDDYSIELYLPENSTILIEVTSNQYYLEYIDYFELNNKKIPIAEIVSNSIRKGPNVIYQIRNE